jgi:hypothetical protein
VSLWTQALDDGAEARADRELLQAGIRPGHRSLYPTPSRTAE